MQLSESQLDHNRLLTLVNSLSDAFMALNSDGVIQLSNSVALSLLDTNSLNGKKISDAMPIIDASGAGHDILSLLSDDKPSFVSRDYRLRYTDGSIVNLYLNISKVRSAFGSKEQGGYVVLASDITSEKSFETERDEFISVASHEMRNPVAVAEGNISNALLLARGSSVPQNILGALEQAHDQIIFVSSLINDLAMISRSDTKKLAESATEFDPVDIIKSLKEDYQDQAEKRGLTIELDPSALRKISGSRLYTREILQNFVTNALKYTEKGGLTLKAADCGKGIDFSVTDTGIGIDKEEQRKLFSKFFRSEDSRVREISGTGLGLYVSAKLARLMGGSISMSSELNKGSTFTLHLPYSLKGVSRAA